MTEPQCKKRKVEPDLKTRPNSFNRLAVRGLQSFLEAKGDPQMIMDDGQPIMISAIDSLVEQSFMVDLCRVLLQHKADPNVRCKPRGLSALDLSIHRNSLDCATLLLQHGAQVSGRWGPYETVIRKNIKDGTQQRWYSIFDHYLRQNRIIAFLTGLVCTPTNSIHRAFAQSPLSERNLLRVIVDFVADTRY